MSHRREGENIQSYAYVYFLTAFYSVLLLYDLNDSHFITFLFLLQSKIVRVLNLWQKNGVFKIDVIQPLLDMAAGSSSSPGLDNSPDGGKTLMCNIGNILF